MPAITDRSSRPPLLPIMRIGHGTLECVDIGKTRRFYEEVLGFDVIQTSPISLLIRKGLDHSYAVVETRKPAKEMSRLNHNGLDVSSEQEVDHCYKLLLKVKGEYGIRHIHRPYKNHGNYSFYFVDLDGNWWEVIASEPGGYAASFGDKRFDLTGRHELDGTKPGHVNDPQIRSRLAGEDQPD